jgi:hypothetical protein
MYSFHYQATDNSFFITVYRHTLHIGINASTVTEEDLLEIVKQAEAARVLLNRDYEYWGTAITVDVKSNIDPQLLPLLKAQFVGADVAKRKVIALTVPYGAETALKVFRETLPKDIPSDTFSFYPLALSYIDDVLNSYASKAFVR